MASDLANCRRCGSQLVRKDHLKFGKLHDVAETWSDGRRGGFEYGADYGWRQNPCPHCKEPEPIRSGWVGIAFGLFLLVFFGGITAAILFLQT